MEDVLKIWDEVLKTVRAFTAWPLITLYLVLLFRRALTKEIPTLFRISEQMVERLTALKYKGWEADFQAFQELAQAVAPVLTQAVAVNLSQAQDQAAKSQMVDEQAGPLVTAAITSKSFVNRSAVEKPLSPEQQKIVTVLESGEFCWRTRDRLLALTGLAPEQLDPSLASLLQQNKVRTAFSSNHNVIFGLRERVQQG
jgi:hypothetical protein